MKQRKAKQTSKRNGRTKRPPRKAAPRPRGRPTDLTPHVGEAILKTLRESGTFEDAAQSAGVALSTLHLWRQRGRENPEGPYGAFFEAVEEALVDRRLARERVIVSHGADDWRAVAWLLERTDFKRYGLRIRHVVEKELTDAIERLEATFAERIEPLTPAQAYELALIAITGGDSSEEVGEDPNGADGAPESEHPTGAEAVQPAPAAPEAAVVPETSG